MFKIFNPYKWGCFIETGDLQSGAGEPPEGVASLPDTGETGDVTGDSESVVSDVVNQKKQSTETDAAFAAMRREKERLEKEAKSRDKWVADAFGESHGIKTWDEYQAAVEKTRQEQAKQQQDKAIQDLKDQGYDVEAIQKILRTDPEFQALKRENEELKKHHQMSKLDREFESLRSEFPHIKTIDDVDDDTLAKFDATKGLLTLSEAYAAVHRKELLGSAKASGEKEAMTKIGSKGHLTTEKSETAGEPEDAIEIPPEKMEVYRNLGFTPKQAREAEKRAKKQRGG